MLMLTLAEFAFLTGRTYEAVRWDVRLGKIKSNKIGSRRLIPASELDFYAEPKTREHLYL